RHCCEFFLPWVAEAPERTFLGQRGPDDAWRRVNYRDAWARIRAIAQALVDRGFDQQQPVAILTGNSIEHALVTFAGMLAGTPVAPISPAYSLHPDGLARLAEIAAVLKPAMVFAQSTTLLDSARKLPGLANAEWVSVQPDPTATSFASLEATEPRDAVEELFARAAPDDVAKILFTSGSTGAPKGVPQTHRMLCSAAQGSILVAPANAPPVLVDWMPWHHTMGGNNTLHGVVRDGGTLYIDDGRPTPDLFRHTIRNLSEISVTAVQNVPAGLSMLVEAMEQDDTLRQTFLRRVGRVAYAGASLSRDTWERLQALSLRTTGRQLPVISGYGTTETAPGVAATHWPSLGQGEIGLPIPGVEIKLMPMGDRFEIRARGPNVMPGYLNRPDLTASAFDDEGFYKIGDAVTFVDPADPRQGLLFAGRISENFKLSNGSWVLTGDLRNQIIATAPSLLDAVVAGHDRDDIRLLVWARPALLASLVSEGLRGEALDAELRRRIAGDLRAHNEGNSGSTRRIAAFALLTTPASLGAGEITDKGYVNQRAVLTNNAALVEELYLATPSPSVTAL
ncbi:MAG: AMP-binding protein, partial [Phenylobacterium sp.]|uniref:AMP-binding protein n=1 Tax=Phenylobacterium sp. TaxID=1871053 RepID=UPI002736422F